MEDTDHEQDARAGPTPRKRGQTNDDAVEQNDTGEGMPLAMGGGGYGGSGKTVDASPSDDKKKSSD